MLGKSLALRGLGGGSIAWLLLTAACGAPATGGASGGASASSTSKASSGSVDARVHAVNQKLAVTAASHGSTTAQGFSASGSSAYTYVASVDAPTNPATKDLLQATNFAFDSTHAYVTYNMAGASTEGAFDIIDLSNPAAPALVSSLIFPSEEFADVAITGTTALLVGEDGNGGLLSVVDISDPAQPREIADLSLGSYYGTSIALDGTTAYIATGDSGGGVVAVDVSNPAAPVIASIAPLENALSAIRTAGTTLALGGSTGTSLFAVASGVAAPLVQIGSEPCAAPVRMTVTGGRVVTNGAHSGLSVLTPAADFSSAAVSFHADLPGTGNGIDVAGSLGILAQGEAGTLLYDFTVPTSPTLLGSFAFPDERGSSNEVRFGTAGGSDYVFLSDGLNGFRIVLVGAATDDAGAACNDPWWLESVPGDWWAVPATSAATSPGAWTSVPSESTSNCVVEQFVPTAANAQCSAIELKRVIAIGPQPNEGQTCALDCPAGTVIANAHSQYGEASPLNAGGSYSCTGAENPDSYTISCDVMSSFCDGQQASCMVTYNNSFCGDPWYNCIKSGRTKWQCVPTASTYGN